MIELQDSNTDEMMSLQNELDALRLENGRLAETASHLKESIGDDQTLRELKSKHDLENQQSADIIDRLTRELEECKLSMANLQNVLETIETEKASESEILLLEWKRRAKEDSETISSLRQELATLKVSIVKARNTYVNNCLLV